MCLFVCLFDTDIMKQQFLTRVLSQLGESMESGTQLWPFLYVCMYVSDVQY